MCKEILNIGNEVGKVVVRVDCVINAPIEKISASNEPNIENTLLT